MTAISILPKSALSKKGAIIPQLVKSTQPQVFSKNSLKDFTIGLGNTKPERVTFDELCEDIRTDYRIRGMKSQERLERSIKNLKKMFKGMYAMEINTARIKRYIDLRQNEGTSNAAINRELSALARMLHLGEQCTPKKVLNLPHVTKLREANPRKGFFEHENFLALREEMPEHLKGLISFAYKTGWTINQ